MRFDKLQSMGEAKFALKLLFEQAGEIQKEKIQTQLKLNELQDSFNEVYIDGDVIKMYSSLIDLRCRCGKN